MHDYAIAEQSHSYLGRKYEIAARLSHQVKVAQGKRKAIYLPWESPHIVKGGS